VAVEGRLLKQWQHQQQSQQVHLSLPVSQSAAAPGLLAALLPLMAAPCVKVWAAAAVPPQVARSYRPHWNHNSSRRLQLLPHLLQLLTRQQLKSTLCPELLLLLVSWAAGCWSHWLLER
jgi:hypothetical protein